MDYNELREKVLSCINLLFERDSYLLINNLNEKTIAHRLAVYLENDFKGFDIDCEYNGYVTAHNNRKYIKILKEKAIELGISKDNNNNNRDIVTRKIFPDIIVHKRGDNFNNLLIIEIKKSTSNEPYEWDFEKLKRYTSNEYQNDLEYQFGAFIELLIDSEKPMFKITWVKEGNEFQINYDRKQCRK